MEKFELDGKTYFFEYDSNKERKVYLYECKDLYDNQKEIIVKKLAQIIKKHPDINISDTNKLYINEYMSGKNKDASCTTNSLGKILNDYLDGVLKYTE